MKIVKRQINRYSERLAGAGEVCNYGFTLKQTSCCVVGTMLLIQGFITSQETDYVELELGSVVLHLAYTLSLYGKLLNKLMKIQINQKESI